MELLGSAILNQAAKKAINIKFSMYHFMANHLKQLDMHMGFFLLKNVFSFPRLLFLLCSSPCYHHSDDLVRYDECTCSTAESICNFQFDDTGWKQANMPVSFPMIWPSQPSRASSRHLVLTILLKSEPTVKTADDVFATWASSDLTIQDDPVRQSNGDSMLCSAQVNALKAILNQQKVESFVAATYKESKSQLNCLPSAAI